MLASMHAQAQCSSRLRFGVGGVVANQGGPNSSQYQCQGSILVIGSLVRLDGFDRTWFRRTYRLGGQAAGQPAG